MKKVTVSAPGKILLLGGYSILERPNVGYVLSVDKRVSVTLKPIKERKIIFDIPQYQIKAEGEFRDNKIVFLEDLDEAKSNILKFVKSAVEICLCYLPSKTEESFRGFEISTFSDPAFGLGKEKTGLGSSAAVTVATVGALFASFGLNIEENANLISRASHLAHFFAQGKVGSGFDISCAVFGTQKYIRFSPSLIQNIKLEDREEIIRVLDRQWNWSVEKIPFPQEFSIVFGNFVGQSTSTSEMVKRVYEFKEMEPDKYDLLMDEINYTNLLVLNAIERMNYFYKNDEEQYQESLQEFKNYFRKARLLTKELGQASEAPIETDEFSALIDESEKNGAFVAKLPGAGGGDAICAICLNQEDEERLKNFWRNYQKIKIEVLDVHLDDRGVKKEGGFLFFD